MSEFLGADTDELLDMGQGIEQRAERLDDLATTLAATVTGVPWTGPDRDAFLDRFESTVRTALIEAGARLGNGARAIYQHAAQQDLASSTDGSIDTARYAELLGGESWSDVINTVQDAWETANPFSDPLTIDDLGGRYVDSPEGRDFDPSSVDLSPEAIREQVMRQGAIGDCWFLSGLMAAAQTDPAFLSKNVTLREDGTWDVTLYEDGEPVVVNVSPDQLARDGARVDSDGNRNTWNGDAIGYMSIYEQAAINHLGPDYESVVADSPQAGLELITGAEAEGSTFLDGHPSIESLDTAIAEGRPVTVMTEPLMPFNSDLAAAHVYQVRSVDTAKNEVELVNPWGDGASKPHVVRVPMDMFYDNNITMTGVGAPKGEWG